VRVLVAEGTKKPAFSLDAKAGWFSLAVFIMRPQAEYQIGAQLKATILQLRVRVKHFG
jgi:hypothetical protein